jgi:hypothetical protein
VGILKRLLTSGAAPVEPLLARAREGGGSFSRLVFTRNRRVMVSVGDGGHTLRVHERFRDAPEEVQRAVGALYARGGARREQAKAVIREFLRELPPQPAAPRRRRHRQEDAAALARLRVEFERVNAEHFGGVLPAVPLSLSGRMRRRNGHFSPNPLEIVISRRLCQRGAAGEAEQTLRHEMIHLWQHHEGRRPGHGADFRRWAERLSIHPRATRAVAWAPC